MPIKVEFKAALPRINVLIRLTAEDTKFLASRIEEAVNRGTGVNLILAELRGAACLISTPERGKEISLNAFTDSVSYRVSSPMRGYNGPWSHIELVFEPQGGLRLLQEFLINFPRQYSTKEAKYGTDQN